MGQIGSDTGRVDNIVEGELGDVLVLLEQQRQSLCFVRTLLELYSFTLT